MVKNLMKFWGDDVIEFYTRPEFFGVIPEPRPAVKFFPDWYRGLGSTYVPQDKNRDNFGNPPMSAKKCFPMLDAMSLGYIIPLAGDTRVITNKDCSRIEIVNPPQFRTAEFHDVRQIGERSAPGFPANPIKWINRWIIKTAPGWSTLFITPINQFNPHFTCLGGMVDTDKYPKEVNFPAVWHTPNFDGSIRAGTPLVQIIPIKRKSIPKKPTVRAAKKKELEEIDRIARCMGSQSNYYTNNLRDKR